MELKYNKEPKKEHKSSFSANYKIKEKNIEKMHEYLKKQNGK